MEEELTPEYIASIANTLTEEELATLIKEYGNEQIDQERWRSGQYP